MRRILLVILFMLSGCSIVSLVPEESLSPASGPSVYLSNTFSFVPASGPTAGVSMSLLPGEYRAVLKDKEGTFYRGPNACIVQKEWKGTFYRDGGIWLPNPGGVLRPRIYAYDGLGTASPKQQDQADAQSASALALALQASPPGASPPIVGAGSGIGSALVGALAQVDKSRVLFITDPMPAQVDIESHLKR